MHIYLEEDIQVFSERHSFQLRGKKKRLLEKWRDFTSREKVYFEMHTLDCSQLQSFASPRTFALSASIRSAIWSCQRQKWLQLAELAHADSMLT